MDVAETGPYKLIPCMPDVENYRRLRHASGLTPKSTQQSLPAIASAWAGCHVVHVPTGEVAAMGRVIGDGGWYFHIVDMATAPDHQRRGLGASVLSHLLRTIDEQAPPNPYVTLMADPPGRRLYEEFGFRATSSEGLVRLGVPCGRPE